MESQSQAIVTFSHTFDIQSASAHGALDVQSASAHGALECMRDSPNRDIVHDIIEYGEARALCAHAERSGIIARD